MSTQFTFGIHGLTVAIWFNVQDHSQYDATIVLYYQSSNQFAMNLEDNGDGGYTLKNYGASATLQHGNINPNVWYHVVLVMDKIADTFTMYVDGQFGASALLTSTNLGGSYTTFLGTDFERIFVGSMRDFRVYNRALSTAEVQALYTISQVQVNLLMLHISLEFFQILIML